MSERKRIPQLLPPGFEERTGTFPSLDPAFIDCRSNLHRVLHRCKNDSKDKLKTRHLWEQKSSPTSWGQD